MNPLTRLALIALAAAAVLAACPAVAAAQPVGWAAVAHPWTSPWALRDLNTFGATGLAACGDEGRIAVSTDGGASWSTRVPPGYEATTFTAVAFNTSGRGVVASGGLLLVSGDLGRTWHAPVLAAPAPAGQIFDVALRDTAGFAVGEGGLILATDDGGASWRPDLPPTLSDVLAVAIAGDGTVVAGTAEGEVLVRVEGAWAVAATVAEPVSAVAAVSLPAWGDGAPDLLASAGSTLLGSDDAAAFAPEAGAPAALGTWPALAWLGAPQRCVLLAGPGDAGLGAAGLLTLGEGAWLATETGLGATVQAAAPGDQSVAYAVGPGGLIARTLSAGRQPAALKLSSRSVTIGTRVRLAGTVRIAAPGRVRLERRVPGRQWEVVGSVPWTKAGWAESLTLYLKPTLTWETRVRFRYGATWTTIATPGVITLRPRITPAKLRYDLRRGSVYRFSGTVSPTLKGERVQLYTDRGGSWRPISLQASVALVDGRTWTSRAFGAPRAETYHLRARMAATRSHGAATSPVVTVTIR
ncbi:MAG: hypothetical protein WC709_11840 [Thermoleophilia bacterium]